MTRKTPEGVQLQEDEMLPEYDFSGGVRGKYAQGYAEGTNLIPIDPDLLVVFSDAKAVNSALRALAGIIRDHTQAPAA